MRSLFHWVIGIARILPAWAIVCVSMVQGQPTGSGATTQPVGGAKPVARPLEPIYKLGTVIQGEHFTHAFKLINAGDATLQILKVSADCNCVTKVGDPPKEIGPGENADFVFTLDTTRILGEFMRLINVETNDPVNPAFTFQFHGESKRLIEMMPTVAGFGRILNEETREQVVTITNRSDHAMTATITDRSSVGPFEFELFESVPGFEFKVFVVFRPPFREGNWLGRVTIQTNVESQKVLTVNASAIVLPRIEVVPPVLYFSAAQGPPPFGAAYATKVIEITNHGSNPLRLTDVSTDDAALNVTTKEVEAGRLYRVLLRTPGKYQVPTEGRKIVCKTDDPQRPTIEIPLRLSGVVTVRGAATSKPSVPPRVTTAPARMSFAPPPARPAKANTGDRLRQKLDGT